MEPVSASGNSERIDDWIEKLNLLEILSPEEVENLIDQVRIEDIAEIFPHLKDAVKNTIFESIGDETAAELLGELDEIPAIQVLKDLPPDRIATICNFLPPDEGADVIGYSAEEDQPEILEQMDQERAQEIQALATYSADTAGGVMTTEFLSAHQNDSVRTILIQIKTSELEDSISNVYVIDDQAVLRGVVSVRELLQAKLNQTVREAMNRDVVSVPLTMDREDVSRIVNRYDFTSIPVVDAGGRIQGIITFDDMMDVIEEESSEDMYRMAGEVAEHPTQQPFLRRIRARMPWLMITLGGTYLAAMVIQVFETKFSPQSSQVDTLWTMLLCFIPMIGGMAGNVGIQSSTVMVRGLATGEVYPSIFARILVREMLLAAFIGLISGLLIGAFLFFLQGQIGFVVGLALFGAIVSAALLGTMMPFACLMVDVDPAYASGPILTTMNDLLGFVIYFGIALLLLH